jgi:hypothetical protein
MNRESNPQQNLAMATMPPIMAPLNMMVRVVIKEEDSADGCSRPSIEETLALEFEKKFTAGAGCGVAALTLQES